MSIRIIPAPARVFAYFDDGIVPLSAKIVDHEDYRAQPWQTPPIAVYQYYQDEPFKLVVATPLDDDYGFSWPIPPVPLGARAWLTEDDALPNAINFIGDDGLGVTTIVTPDRIGQLTAFTGDELAFTTGFTPLFRKTLSGIGGRIGQRQLQG
jgi:hypothetical protein